MEKYFSEGVFEHKEFRETEVGKIPKEWKIVKLGEVCREKKKAVNPESYVNAKFIGLEHIEPGNIRLKNFSLSQGLRSSKNIFNEENILYGKLRPYLDKCAVASFSGICSMDIIVLEPQTDVADVYFLAYLLHTSEFVKFAVQTMSGTNHPRTSWTKIKNFNFSLPPLPEQKEIASRLKAVDDLIETKREEKERLERAKKKVMELLLTGKVRVKSG